MRGLCALVRTLPRVPVRWATTAAKPPPPPPPPPRPAAAGAKAEDADDAELVVPDEVVEHVRHTNPFGTFEERWTPTITQLLNVVVGVLMLSMGLKLARQHGEAVEKEKRLRERIEHVKLEIHALREVLPAAIDAALDKGGASRQAAIQQAVDAAVVHVQEVAKQRFEAALWEGGQDEQEKKQQAGSLPSVPTATKEPNKTAAAPTTMY